MRDLVQEFLDSGKSYLRLFQVEFFNYQTTLHRSSCGDEVRLSAHIDEGIVKHIHHESKGCIVSQASAVRMCENSQGQQVTELLNKSLEEMLGFSPTLISPGRHGCLVLPYLALQDLLRRASVSPSSHCITGQEDIH